MKSFVPFLFRVFVPEFSSRLDVFIVNCSVKLGNDCELSVTVGSSTLRQGSEVKQNCSGLESCSTSVLIPPWNSWLLVTVETNQPNTTIPFSISANVTGLLWLICHFNGNSFLPVIAWFFNVFPSSFTSYTQWDVNLWASLQTSTPQPSFVPSLLPKATARVASVTHPFPWETIRASVLTALSQCAWEALQCSEMNRMCYHYASSFPAAT